jgi:hypothetical protein
MVDRKGKAYLFNAQTGRYIDFGATSDISPLHASTGRRPELEFTVKSNRSEI